MKVAPGAVFLLICFVLTLYQANGHWYRHNWNSRCYSIRNCRECNWFRCTECDPGYSKYRGHCYRRCPGGLVSKQGSCLPPHRGCRYALRGCELCKSRWSCEKCAPGFIALKEPFEHETRCVTRCPYGFKKEMGVCKLSRPCKLRNNCLRCLHSYSKCLDCDIGHVVKMTNNKTDISCKPVSEDCERHGDCVICPGYESCVNCALGFAPELAPGNKSMICKKIECIPNCADCRSENSCIRCSKGYYIYRPSPSDNAQCVSECPSGYRARNDTFCPKCEKIRKCSVIANCEECAIYSKCTRCSEGFAMVKPKLGYRDSCRKRCPRNYHKILNADKTLECRKIKPESRRSGKETTTTEPTQRYTTPEQLSTTSTTEQPTDIPEQSTDVPEKPTDITEEPMSNTEKTTPNPMQQNITSEPLVIFNIS